MPSNASSRLENRMDGYDDSLKLQQTEKYAQAIGNAIRPLGA